MQLVFTLAEQLQGAIDVRSDPCTGTCFDLSFQETQVPANEYALQ
jgi:two-component sensor histidine kinase